MKTPLYYALVAEIYSTGFEVMAVTSEKGPQVYGRDCRNGNPTHRRASTVRYKFETEAQANGAIARAQNAKRLAQPAVDAAELAWKRARREQDALVLAAIEEGLKNG